MLELRKISKSFGGVKAVDEVSINFDSHKIICLTGENGAGKSTLFNLITGFTEVDSGNIFLNGKEITFDSQIERAKKGITRLFQTPQIFKSLSVLNNVLASAPNHPGENIFNYLTGKFKMIKESDNNQESAEIILSQCHLVKDKDKLAGSLSFGQKKLLSLAMLLMNNSDYLLLDEIYAGVNSKIIRKINELLVSHAGVGKTFIIIEHRVNEIDKICHDIIKMKQGKIV